MKKKRMGVSLFAGGESLVQHTCIIYIGMGEKENDVQL